MKLVKKLLILFSLLLCFPSFGRVNLNIALVYKNGIDKGLVLASELHESEHVIVGEKIQLKMRSGVKLIVSALFEISNDGPLNRVVVLGDLYKKDKHLRKITENITIGESKQIQFENSKEIIEISITPELI